MKKFFKVAAALAAALSLTAFGGCEMLHDMFFSHVHEMQFVAEQPATCTAEGVREHYHCTVCNEDFADEDGLTYAPSLTIKALGHDMEYVHQVAPTCTAEGNIGYYKCSRCGGTFAAEDGEVAYSEKDIVLGKTDHTYVATEWEFDGRNHWHECSACGTTIDGSSAAHTYGEDGACTVCGYLPAGDIELGNREDISSADLSIHFLELGNAYTGDCTLIKVGDTEVLIDAGSRKGSGEVICEYVSQYCTDGVLEYVIATHAHQDHIAGFVGNKSGDSRTGVLYNFEVGTLIQFALSDATTNIYSEYCEAVDYVKSQGTTVYTADMCIAEEGGAQRTYYLDEEHTISMNILDSFYYYNSAEKTEGEENNYSVCMLLTQELENGEQNNYLFTGDLEAEGEAHLVEMNELPHVQLFKGGHHGSYTASSDALLSVITPEHVAVCCCAGSTEYASDPNHTFPAQEFIDRVAMYTDSIYCTTLCLDYAEREYTSMNGNIVFYFGRAEGEEQGSLKLWCSNNVTKLKETEWFKQNRTWPEGGV